MTRTEGGYQWREQLNVGNDLIDSDHKHLIELINRVQSCLGASEGVLTSAMNEFSKFLDVHFSREEKIVRAACGEPLAQQIYESHLALLSTLRQIQKESRGAASGSRIQQINGFIGDLMVHLIKQELLMKPALSKFSPSFAPG